MTWLVWRQNRALYLWLAVTLAAVGVFVLTTGIAMRTFEGGIDCLTDHAAQSCGGQGDFHRQFDTLLAFNGWLNLVPAIVGLFLGAPLLARELERGTHRLAWTQGVTRMRWLGAQLGGAVIPALIAGGVIALGMTWWRAPWDTMETRFDQLGYDFEGLMPIATVLLATGLGVLAGTLLRRTLPAIAATVGAFLAIRLPMEFIVRAHLMAPITVASSAFGKNNPNGWVLDSGLVDAAGNRVSSVVIPQDCPGGGGPLDACLNAHGIYDAVTYQPADRFWTFQLIESGIYIAIAAACVALTVWWVRRRVR